MFEPANIDDKKSFFRELSICPADISLFRRGRGSNGMTHIFLSRMNTFYFSNKKIPYYL